MRKVLRGRETLKPITVSAYLGIPGSNLPRITMQTIGRPIQPSIKRGKAGGYSKQDAILMKFGLELLNNGVAPGRCQILVATLKQWINKTEGKRNTEGHTWIIGIQTPGGYSAEIATTDHLVYSIVTTNNFCLVKEVQQWLAQEEKIFRSVEKQ